MEAYHIHPSLAAFPFALITAACLLEGLTVFYAPFGLRSTIKINLILAAVFVIFAFFSGYLAEESASVTFKIDHEKIEFHHLIGRLLLFAIIPCAALCCISDIATGHRVVLRGAYLVLLLLCLSLVLYTGYLGAELVFRQGAGVIAVN